MPKLFFSDGSPYARKVRIVLAELGLNYEHDRQDFVRPIEALRDINPNLTIPIYEDNDLRLFDSHVIVEYLLETYPPKETSETDRPFFQRLTRNEHRWEDRKTLATLETLTESVVNIRMMQLSGIEPEQIDYLRRQSTRIATILDWLDKRASSQGFIPGFFSIMDIELLCAVDYVDARGITYWRGRNNLDRLVDGLRDRPSVASTHPS